MGLKGTAASADVAHLSTWYKNFRQWIFDHALRGSLARSIEGRSSDEAPLEDTPGLLTRTLYQIQRAS